MSFVMKLLSANCEIQSSKPRYQFHYFKVENNQHNSDTLLRYRRISYKINA